MLGLGLPGELCRLEIAEEQKMELSYVWFNALHIVGDIK